MKVIASASAAAVLATAGLATVGLAGIPQTAEAQSRGAPRGSYAQTCEGAYVNRGRLYADCRDSRGNYRPTSIELARCSSSDIGNDNGLLVCYNHRGDYENSSGGGRPPGGGWGNDRPGGGWGGGGRDSITVYRDSDYRGQSATFTGEVPNLSSTGLNDQISSMRFNGAWEACTDSQFRGNCQVFRDSVRNLSDFGMNDRISSIRPARGGWGW